MDSISLFTRIVTALSVPITHSENMGVTITYKMSEFGACYLKCIRPASLSRYIFALHNKWQGIEIV